MIVDPPYNNILPPQQTYYSWTPTFTSNILTDQEVWLRIYCAKLSADYKHPSAHQAAEVGLKAFRDKFPLF